MIDSRIFRACDIRGKVATQLTEEALYRIGLALAAQHFSAGQSILLARDARLHSEALAQALSKALLSCGLHVLDAGLATTPMLYFGIQHKQLDGGIVITGSHNPADENGLKICKGNKALKEDDFDALRDLVLSEKSLEQDKASGNYQRIDLLDAYIATICQQINVARPLHVVVDAGNGAAGPVIVPLLHKLGVQLTPLYCEPDGHFPNHHPDPSEAENLHACRETLLREGADLGLAFDGDGDRLGVLAADGTLIPADRLLALFARDQLKRTPGATIIGDVKCSSFCFKDIEAHGGVALMSRTGHAFIKARMLESAASLAGEMSGHFFFGQPWYGFDDAVYAAARLIEIVSHEGDPLQALASLPSAFSTPEIRLACPEQLKFAIAQDIAATYRKRLPIVEIDGARIDFPRGWALLRASNTQALISMRIEAESREDARVIADDLLSELSAFLEEHQTELDFSPLIQALN